MTDDLKKLAEAATQGEWSLYNGKLCAQFSTTILEVQADDGDAVVHWMGFDGGDRPKKQKKANAAYIAAASPKNILALLAELESLKAERDKLVDALGKINEIRNSIVGMQTINWSEHIYPLVAALNEAGIEGMSYPEARENMGKLIDQINKAEAERDALRRDAGRWAKLEQITVQHDGMAALVEIRNEVDAAIAKDGA